MDLLAKVVFVALVLGAIWWALRPRRTFVVRIRGGEPRLVQGKVTEAFLHEIRDACRLRGVRHGLVSGVLRGQRTVLVFSRSVPEACRQQLRNVWALHG